MLSTKINRKEEDEQIRIEDKIILSLEKDMKKDVKALLIRIQKDFIRTYTNLGLIPDQTQYRKQWETILTKHYKRAGKIFSKTLRSGTKKSHSFFETKADDLEISREDNAELNKKIATELSVWIIENAKRSAQQIIDTNQRQLNDAVRRATKDLTEKKSVENNLEVKAKTEPGVLVRFISDKDIATEAGKTFGSKIAARSELIATQEVGKMVSEAKFQEAKALNESDIEIEGKSIKGSMKKAWNAILDGRTRNAHADADFRYHSNPIPLIEKFIVGGEALNYPRDPAGSAKNTINCRCQMVNIADI